MLIEKPNFEDIYVSLISELLERPRHRPSPRGQGIREIPCVTFELTDPRARRVLLPERTKHYGFGVGELCWYLRADDDLETMLYYNKGMGKFSDDGRTINSAYGLRIFEGPPHSPSQWDMVVKELSEDPDSRRAVIHINQPRDLLKATLPDGSKDVPCTMSLQFFVRDRKLNLHVTMRSNDIWLGTIWDVWSFTCIQECMLYDLQEEGVPVDDLGSYFHTATSLHLYERDVFRAEELISRCVDRKPSNSPLSMAPFTMGDMERLVHEWEPAIRRRGEVIEPDPSVGDSVRWMLLELEIQRRLRDRGL